MIFIDTNIPIYLVGTDHPNKATAQRLTERSVALGDRLVTDAEVLQEIIHRYSAIDRLAAIEDAFNVLMNLADEVFPIESTDVQRARRLVVGPGRMSARDALHAAIMQRYDVAEIMTFDRGFDGLPGIRRLSD